MKYQSFESFSQNLQDWFVFQLFRGREGFFLDLGAGNGGVENADHSFLSNTYALESFANWNGICIDIDKTWCEKARKNRRAKIAEIDLMKNNINTVLDDLDCPSVVDYLSFDVDNAYTPAWTMNEKILDELDFNKRQFKVITFEHNLFQALSTSDQSHNYDYKQNILRFYDKSRNIFKDNGYEILIGNITNNMFGPFEDWYIKKDVFASNSGAIVSREFVKGKELMELLKVG